MNVKIITSNITSNIMKGLGKTFLFGIIDGAAIEMLFENYGLYPNEDELTEIIMAAMLYDTDELERIVERIVVRQNTIELNKD